LFPYYLGYCQEGKFYIILFGLMHNNLVSFAVGAVFGHCTLSTWSNLFSTPYFTGSSVPYDDSMNLRNVLWLAPLPSNETKAWLAPGRATEHSALFMYSNLLFS
jgi:hypothetical protein